MKLLRSWTALAALVASATTPVPAAAQAARTGPMFIVSTPGTLVLLPDVAYDHVHDRYLVVSEVAHVAIDIQVLNGSGNVLASNRVRHSPANAQNPRVAFSPDVNNGAGGYLVTWHETVNGSTAHIWGRLVSADGALLTSELGIGVDAGSSNWSMGPAISYSTASREFLVAWMAGYGGANDIRFTRVNTAGAVLQAASTLITAGTSDWERDPSVAYNPHQDEFYIAYAGWVNAGNYGFVSGQRIKAGTGALIGGPTSLGVYSAPLIPSVNYNAASRQYLVGWYNRTSTGQAVYGVPVGGADGVAGTVRLLSAYYASYDALDVDYNPVSGDYLLVTHGFNHEDAAVSIKSDNTPYDNGFLLTNTTDLRGIVAGDGNFNPRVVASTSQPRYLTVTSSKFAAVHGQFATSSAAGGQPPPPPPPPPATPDTRLYVDSPRNGATVAGTLLISGWALDVNASAGNGVDAVHAYAFPLGGGQIFLGSAPFSQRLDVANHFGDSRFSNSGFTVFAALPPDIYTIRVYARSTVTGTFHSVWTVQIRVTPPPNPHMAIDQPLTEWSSVPSSFWISGWAIDASSFEGSGVDAVHAWAYPVIGSEHGAPVWVGAALVGMHRPDVAQAIGNGRFAYAGFAMVGTLPPGVYDLVIYARSWIAGAFNNWRTVRITVTN